MPELENKPEYRPGVIENRAVKPPGILPKNMQAMVIAGISLVMVAAIAFSGSSAPRSTAKAILPASPTVIDPNQARIAEYRQRLDEQARKLAAEQAEFQQARQQFTSAGGVQTGTAAAPASGSFLADQDQTHNEQDSIENDRKRRVYLSLFASNVALSYRRENGVTTAGQNPTPNAVPASPLGPPAPPTPSAYLIPSVSASGGGEQARAAATGGSRAAVEPGDSEPRETKEKTNAPDRSPDLNQWEGKQYRLFEGTVLETVLTNRLNGAFAGPINAMVTTNVYSHDGQQLLIPQGSRLLGEVKRVTTFGQERLAVVFHRLIMPDGFSVSLDQFKGLNQIGETGLRDQINHHYTQIFGVSVAIGAIAGLAQAQTRGGIIQSSPDAYRQGVADSLSQSSLHILDRYLNVLPTLAIREGHRVKVYLSDDLLVPAYQNHRMPGDL